MATDLDSLLNLNEHPLHDQSFVAQCRQSLEDNGVLVLRQLLTNAAIDSIRQDGEQNAHLAYFKESAHNAYLASSDDNYSTDHPRNRHVTSSKGCITTDQIPTNSALHTLYNSESFKRFLCAVLKESGLYEYADPLSSINLHYAADGQELGWHFDNSSFAITLLIQKPKGGGVFEYVKDARNAEAGDMNFELVGQVLDRQVEVDKLDINPGDLVLFRGRNSLHRVTPTEGDTTRMLAVLAYNTEPGVSLSASARDTFYGRQGTDASAEVKLQSRKETTAS